MAQLYRLSQTQFKFSTYIYAPLVIICFFISLWVGTEHSYHQAAVISYDLGPHEWYSILTWTLTKNNSVLDPILTQGLQLTLKLLGVLLISLLVFYSYVQRNLKKTDTHGSSRWSTFSDIEKAGLINQKEGLYIGKIARPGSNQMYLLKDSSDTHVIVVAPTGSGKGVGLVIPNLLSWKGSVIVHDLKGENYNITSGYRKNGLKQNVFRFDPTCEDGSGACFNPLAEIRLGLYEVKDTQAIVDMIIDPEGKGKPSHWDKTADAFLVGVILHSLYSASNKTLNGVLYALSDPRQNIHSFLEAMLETEHDPTEGLGWRDPLTQEPTRTHPVVASIAREMLNKEKAELSGVVSTAVSFLSLYRDPLVAKNTSRSDFSINDLMKNDKPASLYLIVSPADQKRVYPLTRLLMNQFCIRLMENVATEDRRNLNGHKHKMLFMMDEFTSLGRLDVFQDSLSYMRGYGIRAMLICQDLDQLKAKYGERSTVLSHCKTKIFYAANSKSTADQISQYAGEATVLKYSKSYSQNNMNHVNEGASEIKRPLLTADEATRLPADGVFIHREGEFPLLVKKINYLQNEDFLERANFKKIDQSVHRLGVDTSISISEMKRYSPSFQGSESRKPTTYKTGGSTEELFL